MQKEDDKRAEKIHLEIMEDSTHESPGKKKKNHNPEVAMFCLYFGGVASKIHLERLICHS